MRDLEIVKELILLCNKKEKNVEKLSEKILEKYKSVYLLLKEDKDIIIKDKDIPKKLKECIISISNIYLNMLKVNIEKQVTIHDFEKLIEYLNYRYFDKDKEIFMILYFNVKNVLIKEEDLFLGTLDQSSIYIREIIKDAIKYSAKSIIVVHNHPSGNTCPSIEDINVTKKIKEACKYFDIILSDHIIISNNKYYSFLKNSKL